MNQNAAEPVAAAETLAEVPEHVLRGLPEEVRLFPSAVDKTRIGVWATKPILKGKKFGPFVGDKKKRSQVKNNVYMWEVRNNSGPLFIRTLCIFEEILFS